MEIEDADSGHRVSFSADQEGEPLLQRSPDPHGIAYVPVCTPSDGF